VLPFIVSDYDGIAELAGLENAGLEFDVQSRRGGICRTGK